MGISSVAPRTPAALDRVVVAEFLAACSLFRGCDRPTIDRIAPHIAGYDFGAGTVIQRAGSLDAQIGIVFAGRVLTRTVNAATGQATVIEELQVGDYFGEVGAVLQLAQPHEAYAESSATALIVTKEVVQQLATKVPTFAQAIAKKLANRVVQMGVASMRATPARGTAVAEPPAKAAEPETKPEAGVRFVRAGTYAIDSKLIAMVPARIITQYRVLPLELVGRALTIGMVDPFNNGAIAELQRVVTSADLKIVAISAEDWSEAVVRLKVDPSARGAVPAKEQVAPDTLVFDAVAEAPETKAAVIGDEVVGVANRIIAAAIERNASDVHVEPDATGVRVRFRIAGSLVDWDQFIATSYSRGIAARIKVLAGLDITEKRLPQDGRIGLRIGKREVDLRVSTLPASRGEKIVMRLLEASTLLRPLDSIFLDPRTLGWVRTALNRPHGAIIVAGPTGSGKSSTLYAALNERRKTRPDTNIVMVEDPIEYRLSGTTQVQVSPAAELTYPRVLRAFLRQDPDVIMVGEIRDRETAMMALEAAMTGHLLFTSIHANDALGVLQRFENLGCQREVLAQSISLVLVQRLARKVCPRCVTSEVAPPILQESLEQRGLVDRGSQIALPRGAGCAECSQTGYQGRVAVIEALQFPDPLRDALMGQATVSGVEEIALKHQAFMPFRRSAAFLMSRNLLSPTEALLTVA